MNLTELILSLNLILKWFELVQSSVDKVSSLENRWIRQSLNLPNQQFFRHKPQVTNYGTKLFYEFNSLCFPLYYSSSFVN